MAPPAHEQDVASGGRRRGGRNLSWRTVLCFGRGQQEASSEGTTTKSPWERLRRRRKKRTVVPVVDGHLVAGTTAAYSELMTRRGTGTGTDEEEESPSRNRNRNRNRKRLLLWACCFSAPVERASGRNKRKVTTTRLLRSRSDDNNSPSSEASQIQATGGSTSNGNGSRSATGGPAETTTTTTTRAPTKPCGCGCGCASSSKAARADGVGAFGPVTGLSVVLAVSMAGLLGGRLWAVACVCAWLAALSRIRRRRREAAAMAAGEVAVDVDSSTDHKEPVVLRALLERDRRKAVGVAA